VVLQKLAASMLPKPGTCLQVLGPVCSARTTQRLLKQSRSIYLFFNCQRVSVLHYRLKDSSIPMNCISCGLTGSTNDGPGYLIRVVNQMPHTCKVTSVFV
jgi:hypothetical protein